MISLGVHDLFELVDILGIWLTGRTQLLSEISIFVGVLGYSVDHSSVISVKGDINS